MYTRTLVVVEVEVGEVVVVAVVVRLQALFRYACVQHSINPKPPPTQTPTHQGIHNQHSLRWWFQLDMSSVLGGVVFETWLSVATVLAGMGIEKHRRCIHCCLGNRPRREGASFRIRDRCVIPFFPLTSQTSLMGYNPSWGLMGRLMMMKGGSSGGKHLWCQAWRHASILRCGHLGTVARSKRFGEASPEARGLLNWTYF